MRFSTKVRYGARAIVEIAKNYTNTERTRRKDIEEHQGIPAAYLENILMELKGKGLVSTTRGPRGGFVLTREPATISMLDVVEALDGTLAPVECVGKDPGCCEREESCHLKWVWEKLRDAQAEVLKNISLQDLVDKGGAVGEDWDLAQAMI
jgi:Rrf2 family protein